MTKKSSIQIFRPGRHVAANGSAYSFSESDLAASARAYDPAKHEAPLVIGHPAHDAPAYGWVKGLAIAGGGLDAEPHQVDPAFAEMVAAGRFKKISASFYAPDAPNNPVAGVYYLRHVGFLGAAPPAVKGLRAAEFAANEAGVIEFTDWNAMTVAGLFRRVKNFFIEQFGQDKADAALPEYDIESLTLEAARTDEPAAVAAGSMMYAEQSSTQGVTMTPEEITARDAALKAKAEEQARKDAEQAAKDAQFAEREARLAAEEAKRARIEVAEFVGGLVKIGKVLPAHQDGLIAFMAGLDAAAVIQFGEGDKAVKKAGAAWLREYLAAQPKLVEFRELAGGATDAADLADPQVLAAKALELRETERKAGREISITQAVNHLTKGGK